jgi:periplasmic copper chaperone A
MFLRAFLVGALALAGAAALADPFTAGDIVVSQPFVRATAKGASVGAGYMVVRNNGKVADRLVRIDSDVANMVALHEMSNDGGIMKMREMTDGATIPPGGAMTFRPGGNHLMFTGLKAPFLEGGAVKATLQFEHAGALPIDFKIGGLGAMGASKAHPNDMPGMKMK